MTEYDFIQEYDREYDFVKNNIGNMESGREISWMWKFPFHRFVMRPTADNIYMLMHIKTFYQIVTLNVACNCMCTSFLKMRKFILIDNYINFVFQLNNYCTKLDTNFLVVIAYFL